MSWKWQDPGLLALVEAHLSLIASQDFAPHTAN
jgi:hypothetical protein